RRPELEALFCRCSGEDCVLSDEELLEFLREQGEEATLSQAREIIQEYELNDTEPIVYHGHTLTSRILFREVIEVVRDYAFKASPYPLILSLENHCGREQQVVMARHLRSILGETLLTKSPGSKGTRSLPSPEELKGRILIKGKKLSGSDSSSSSSDSSSCSEEEEGSGEGGGTRTKNKNKKKDSVKVSLSVKLLHGARNSFVRHNARQLSRIYPSGLRAHSSNYSPQEMWNAGCQIVALNFQTPGEAMALNQGRFLQNGLCGYTLKPAFLRSADSTFDPEHPARGQGYQAKTLTVTVTALRVKGSDQRGQGQALPVGQSDETSDIPRDWPLCSKCLISQCKQTRQRDLTSTVQQSANTKLKDASFQGNTVNYLRCIAHV
ncbi:1-phosphatidylinositol 4,5-bisphosphate phosphodiesterase delta-3-A, partial [Acipenser ruthenus]